MNDAPEPIIPSPLKHTLGDRIRGIANELRQESDVQIKVTSRILGAAAQIAQNHDRLIHEVVEMVEEDLDKQAYSEISEVYTIEQLQQQFKTLKDAKAHFGIKAASWAALVSKLNEPIKSSSSPDCSAQESLDQRLRTIEQDVQTIRETMNQGLRLLHLIAEKLL